MSICMTQKVCEHMAAIPKKSLIGNIYMKDYVGKLQLLKADQRIIQREFGHYYWRAGTVDCYVVKISKNKYEVRI